MAEARKLLRVFGDRKFGRPDARAVVAIERIEDLARLEDLCDRLETAGSWQELLGLPAPAPRGGRRRQSS